MAIVLDRVTTAASVRAENGPAVAVVADPAPAPALIAGGGARDRCGLAVADLRLGGGVPVRRRGRQLDRPRRQQRDRVGADQPVVVTNGIKDVVTYGADQPAAGPAGRVALVAGRRRRGGAVRGARRVRAAIISAVCLGLLVGTGLWQDSMTTLAATLVATVIVMILGVAFGVWMGRSRRVDRIIRPILDAGQTMPPFVYLVPFLALFGPPGSPRSWRPSCSPRRSRSRSSPTASAGVGDHRRGGHRGRVQPWQIITKVQLPMARKSLTLATNQGLIYVLSMVVVGGLVGAGALGYDVVAGFSQGAAVRQGPGGRAGDRPAGRDARPDHPGGGRRAAGEVRMSNKEDRNDETHQGDRVVRGHRAGTGRLRRCEGRRGRRRRGLGDRVRRLQHRHQPVGRLRGRTPR